MQKPSLTPCGSSISGDWVLAAPWPAAAGSPLKRLPQWLCAEPRRYAEAEPGSLWEPLQRRLGARLNLARCRGIAAEAAPTNGSAQNRGVMQKPSPALCGSRFSGDWVLASTWPAAAGSPLKRLPQWRCAEPRRYAEAEPRSLWEPLQRRLGARLNPARCRGVAAEAAPTMALRRTRTLCRSRASLSVGAASAAIGACLNLARCRGNRR